MGLGDICHRLGQHDQATGYQQEALALYREIGDRGGEAEALNGAGETLLAAGQPSEALTCHDTALSLASRTGDRYQQARAQHGLAGACFATGQHEAGQQHWQAALDIYTSLGVPEAAQSIPAGGPAS
jgi:tetratricopeptide (TPR) repeat protein